MKRIVLVAILALLIPPILIPRPAAAMTRSEILEQVRYGIRDTTDTVNSPRWSSDILNKRIDLIQKQIACETYCIYKETTTDVVADKREYNLPTDCYKVDRVAFLSQSSTTASMQYKKLKAYTIPGLDNSVNVLWENLPSGLPLRYAEFSNTIILSPAPSSVYTATGAIKIDYYALADTLSGDTSVPWNNVRALYGWHYLIIKGVVEWCLRDEGEGTADKVGEYQGLIKRMADALVYHPDQRDQDIPVDNR